MIASDAPDSVYVASPIKRTRATKEAVLGRRQHLYNIVAGMKPMTVRQAFYQATVVGLVEKSEAGYSKIQTDLALMRKSGAMPYDWLADNTRWQRKPRSFDGVEEAPVGDCKALSEELVGSGGVLRRSLAREGRAGRRRHAGHVLV